MDFKPAVFRQIMATRHYFGHGDVRLLKKILDASKDLFRFMFIQAIWSGRIPNVTQHLDQESSSK